MIDLLSAEYQEQLVKLHHSRIWGASGYSHAPVVADYRRELKAKTVLDFGCGRATLKKTLLRLDPLIGEENIFEYDPAISEKSNPPSPADLFVATDVLEHIEFAHFDKTMKYIRSLAKRGAYFTISVTPSKVSLPDGRNAHLIIKPRKWWIDKLKEAEFIISKAEDRKGLWVWAR